MDAWLEVIDGGLAVSIQDRGRFGRRALGVPVCGALDPVFMAAANGLLGNAPDAACLELPLLGPRLRAGGGPVRVALAGEVDARLTDRHGGARRIPAWSTCTLFPDDTLQVGAVRLGPAYLAVSGGIRVKPVLGSRATFIRAALGGVDGRPVQAADRLPCGPATGDLRQEFRGPGPLGHADGPIRVILGPQQDHFTDAALADFLARPFTVSAASDRMGMRLTGTPLAHRPGCTEIISDGVTPGAIQVPPDGQPIVLLADCQTSGGYPKIACVISADLPRLGHLVAGARLDFAAVDAATAALARQAMAARLADWLGRVQSFSPPLGLDLAALYGGNLAGEAIRGDDPHLWPD